MSKSFHRVVFHDIRQTEHLAYTRECFRDTYSQRNKGCNMHAAAAAKSLQSCPTLCDPIDGSPPSSSVHGIFQARVLEWGAIAFSICIKGTEAQMKQVAELFPSETQAIYYTQEIKIRVVFTNI